MKELSTCADVLVKFECTDAIITAMLSTLSVLQIAKENKILNDS